MADNEKKAVVLGIGNLLMGDEGFGIHVLRHLERNFVFPENVRLVDCGTAGIYMAPFFEDADVAIVMDAALIDGLEPGKILRLNHQEVRAGDIQSSLSPHQIGVLEILEICRLRDTLPSKVEFFLVIPQRVEPTVELSHILEGKVEEMARLVTDYLTAEGFQVKNA